MEYTGKPQLLCFAPANAGTHRRPLGGHAGLAGLLKGQPAKR